MRTQQSLSRPRVAAVAFTCFAAALMLLLPARARAAVTFIGPFNNVQTIASMVPKNGDVNPYGVAVVPTSNGRLTAGDVLVSNFNNAAVPHAHVCILDALKDRAVDALGGVVGFEQERQDLDWSVVLGSHSDAPYVHAPFSFGEHGRRGSGRGGCVSVCLSWRRAVRRRRGGRSRAIRTCVVWSRRGELAQLAPSRLPRRF
jgi:hypothetical protein